MRYTGRLAVFALVIVACVGTGQVGTQAAGVKSQLRGYDLGPPFPAGLRAAGLVDGYAEGEWVPFVAVVKGKKLADAERSGWQRPISSPSRQTDRASLASKAVRPRAPLISSLAAARFLSATRLTSPPASPSYPSASAMRTDRRQELP